MPGSAPPKRSSPSRWREKESSVHSPASGSTGPASCWARWSLRVVGDVLAEALLAAAVQVDDGRAPLELGARWCGGVPRARRRRSRAGGRRARRRRPWVADTYRPADPRRCRAVTEALRFWALIELIGLGAAPLAGVLLARLPGAGLGLGKVLGLLLVTWLVWIGGSLDADPVRRAERGALDRARLRARAARLGARLGGTPRGRARRAARLARAPALAPARRARAGARPAARAAVLGRRGRLRRRVRAMALLVAYSPDVWNTEKPMDMAFLNAANRADTFPPQDPWLAGARPQLLLPRPPRDGACSSSSPRSRPDQGYNLAVAALFALTAAAVFTLGGDALGARRAGRAARCAPGSARSADRARRRQPRGRAAADRRRRPAARLRLVRRLARDRRHDQRVPVVLVPARRPARARARAAVHAARARVRAAGRARRPAAGAARARAARGARGRARARLALRGQLVVVSGHRGPARARACSPGCATRAASAARPAAVRWLLVVLAR